MIGLVLVTHGKLAAEFRAALEHVMGPQDHCETISIGPDDDMDERRHDIVDAVNRVDAASDTFNGAVAPFVDYYLSDEGIENVTAAGYVQLAPEALEETRAAWQAAKDSVGA